MSISSSWRSTSSPDLPAFLTGEYRDRVCHRSIGSPVEMLPEQDFQFSALQSEGRTTLAVLEEKKSGDPALRPEQLEHALHIARPQRARKRTQESALVHEIERPVETELKEIVETNEVRDRSQGPLRAFHRRGREVDRERLEPRFGESAHFVARAAARNQHAPAARLRFQESFERRRNSARVPGRKVFTEALFPEFWPRCIFPRH